MNLGLIGKTAIVLASSRGLGKASALALAREGANIVIGARNREELFNTADEIIKETMSKVVAIPTDVTNLKDLENIVEKAIKEFKTVNILVNNASGPPSGTFEQTTDELWQKAFELNLLSTIRMTRLVLPYMKKLKGGRIINMVSISSKQPVANLILSNSIRAGVLGMAKTLSDEIASDNITVNNILTAGILTDRIKQLYHIDEKMQKGISEKEAWLNVINEIPLKRLGKPEEFGALVAFLASEQAGFITGTSIQIDGGQSRSLF